MSHYVDLKLILILHVKATNGSCDFPHFLNLFDQIVEWITSWYSRHTIKGLHVF